MSKRRLIMPLNIHAIERPILRYFRTKRLRRFYKCFEIDNSVRILDLGGTLFFWELAQQLGYPVPQITIVNLDRPKGSIPDNVEWLVRDALSLDFRDSSFDLVFCNSLIEHLGNWESQSRLAKEIARLAPHHFVQTPSRDFPFELHLLAPFIHWLPKRHRVKLIRNFTIWGLLTRPSIEHCHSLVEELRLLDADEMATLFPRSQIIVERSLGLPKSIIAIGGNNP